MNINPTRLVKLATLVMQELIRVQKEDVVFFLFAYINEVNPQYDFMYKV